MSRTCVACGSPVTVFVNRLAFMCLSAGCVLFRRHVTDLQAADGASVEELVRDCPQMEPSRHPIGGGPKATAWQT